MTKRFTFALLGVAMLAGAASFMPARAQDSREAEVIGLHQLCDRGDRRACVRFGMALQRNQDRNSAWRRTHPEFFWWEH